MKLTPSWRPIKPGLLLKGFLGISGLVAGACLVNSQAANAYAHNLVTNGTFDTSLHGWNIITIPEIGRFSWDVFGNPSGSARGDKVSGPGSALYSRILGQSISTIAGEEYAIAFQLYNPNPGLGVVEASFDVFEWFSRIFGDDGPELMSLDEGLDAISFIESDCLFISNPRS